MNNMTDFFTANLEQNDPEIAKAIHDELVRQQDQIEMIASENIVSSAVLEAQGSVLTNKYAEGYSGRRYYGGCEYVDVVETLAIERAKNFLTVILSMFSHIQGHRPIRLYFWHCCSQGIRCWVCHWKQAGI